MNHSPVASPYYPNQHHDLPSSNSYQHSQQMMYHHQVVARLESLHYDMMNHVFEIKNELKTLQMAFKEIREDSMTNKRFRSHDDETGDDEHGSVSSYLKGESIQYPKLEDAMKPTAAELDTYVEKEMIQKLNKLFDTEDFNYQCLLSIRYVVGSSC